MSDSAEIWVTNPPTGESVCFYINNGWEVAEDILFTTLLKRIYWDEQDYFCRVLFCTIMQHTGEDLDGLNNLGISSNPGNAEKMISVDLEKGFIRVVFMDYSGNNLGTEVVKFWSSFDDFINQKKEEFIESGELTRLL